MRYYVTQDALNRVSQYLKRKNIPYEIIRDTSEIGENNEKSVIFTINKGSFLMQCPGTPKYICCGYYVLAPAENCPYECTYCILNAYFKDRHIRIFVNTDDMIKELNIIARKGNIRRIGTGEFSDSMFTLSTELYSKKLINFFNKNKNIFLELKTKSNKIIEDFFYTKNKNIIFSWSMNSKKINETEEIGTSSIEERIALAKLAINKGYPVSFHFDPIIEYNGWEDDYYETIKLIFQNINPEAIKWISLGTLRFIPSLKDIAKSLYPKTKIFNNEFILALDGKKRYFRKKRVNIYKKMYELIRSYDSKVFVYMCMENEDVWEDVTGLKMNSKKLKELMDAQLDK